MDHIVEIIEKVAAYCSCKGGATPFAFTQHLTGSEAVVKLKYLPFLARP